MSIFFKQMEFSFYQNTSQYYHTTLQVKYPESYINLFSPPPPSPSQVIIINLSRRALIIHNLVTHYH